MNEKTVLTVPEWLVRGIIILSGILNIFVAFFIVINTHNVPVELALLLSGFLLIVGAVGFESWTPDKK